MKKTYTYNYVTIKVAQETAQMAENVMKQIGCKTLNTFTTMALIDYCKKTKSDLGLKD